LHSLLRRQLKRFFPDQPVPTELQPMLEAVNQAYQQFDNDRSMLERSLDLSSQELLQANGELRALVSAFPDHIVRLRPNGVIIDIKGAPSEQSRRWLPGHDYLETLDVRARPAVLDALHRVVTERAAVNIELEAGSDSATPRFYEARLLPLEDAQVLMILRDVTERHYGEKQLRASQMALHEAHRDLERRVEERTAALGRANDELRREMADRQAAESARSQLEEQLRHAQKMEAIGRLSGGIAHDFNNLLTAIRGYSELLLKELQNSPLLRADVEEIFNAADRAATLTGQLLAFSRRQILSPEIVVLNQRVTDMSRMLDRLIGEHIGIDLRLASDLWSVRADAAQLEQVLVNLALNARDAMPEGGRLAIETANREITAQEAQVLDIARGAFVELRVRDTGVGIPLEVQGRIFEPFFTTKPKGAGTGLGLSMVYGFVRQSGGAVSVDSAPGRGSTFSLLLPRTDDTDRTPTPKNLLPQTERGSGTVLIAEDERALRRLSATVLGQAGYRTFEAADGQQALDLFTAHAHEIVVVVTDVVMPRMGGIELAKRLRQTQPNVPILFVTGYVEQSDALHESAAGTPVLLKPFSPEALLRAVSAARQAAK
jgi:signal transduction histidine kinase/CheY-like chemotaxis protein